MGKWGIQSPPVTSPTNSMFSQLIAGFLDHFGWTTDKNQPREALRRRVRQVDLIDSRLGNPGEKDASNPSTARPGTNAEVTISITFSAEPQVLSGYGTSDTIRPRRVCHQGLWS